MAKHDGNCCCSSCAAKRYVRNGERAVRELYGNGAGSGSSGFGDYPDCAAPETAPIATKAPTTNVTVNQLPVANAEDGSSATPAEGKAEVEGSVRRRIRSRNKPKKEGPCSYR